MSLPKLEQRGAAVELRAHGRRLVGHAALFGVNATIGAMVETIRPGAFARSLAAGADVLALVDHDPSRLLARTRSGTLRLAEDAKGLGFEIDLPETRDGADLLALAARGDLGGMSFGFRVPKGGEEWAGSRRTLKAVDLIEISVVAAHPAYPHTTVGVRAAGQALGCELRRRWLETL